MVEVGEVLEVVLFCHSLICRQAGEEIDCLYFEDSENENSDGDTQQQNRNNGYPPDDERDLVAAVDDAHPALRFEYFQLSIVFGGENNNLPDGLGYHGVAVDEHEPEVEEVNVVICQANAGV